MKYLVLDTNIILKDPSLLRRWSPNYKLIIPDFLHGEIDRVASKLGVSHQIWETINKTNKSNFVDIPKQEITVPKEDVEQFSDYGVSDTDLQLFKYCQQLQNENKDVVLVTNDVKLRRLADSNKVKTFDLYQLKFFIDKNVTTDIDELKQHQTITQYQNRRFFLGVIAGCLLSGLVYLIAQNFDVIYATLSVWGTVVLCVVLGTLFFLLRTNFRNIYGLLEILFGFYITIRIFINKDFDYYDIKIIDVIQIISGVYVIVRGLSNIDEGIKGTRIEPSWKKITRWK